jgi:hypothetical protein
LRPISRRSIVVVKGARKTSVSRAAETKDPAARRFARSLKMAEEPPKEPIAVVIARLIEPGVR